MRRFHTSNGKVATELSPFGDAETVLELGFADDVPVFVGDDQIKLCLTRAVRPPAPNNTGWQDARTNESNGVLSGFVFEHRLHVTVPDFDASTQCSSALAGIDLLLIWINQKEPEGQIVIVEPVGQGLG